MGKFGLLYLLKHRLKLKGKEVENSGRNSYFILTTILTVKIRVFLIVGGNLRQRSATIAC